MMHSRAMSVAVVTITMLGALPVSAEWLEFGAGCPAGSEPLTFHNITMEDLISFDVELQGLLVDTVEHEGINYLRFDNSPGTVPMDETGFPEIPVVTCFLAVPDDSDLNLSLSAGCLSPMECLPIYPAPLDSIVADSTCSPYVGEFFRKDSSAYASEDWYPSELAEITGEFMLRDQRVAVVNVHPVQYLASEDSLRVWSDIGLAIEFTGADPDWNENGLGYFDRLIGDRLIGYAPVPGPWHPIDPAVYRPTDLVNGPPIVPDYVIVVASGLDGQHVTELAQHRVDLDGFNVVIATTDDIYSQFNQGALHLTPGVIRNFTEAMWDWHPESPRRPSYLLLIGDHEEVEFENENWFLPVFESEEDEYGNCYCNDEWYVCFGDDREEFTGFPDMMVGRIPARKTKDLIDMIDVIIDYETGGIPPELEDKRRHITRLAGTHEDTTPDNGEDNWEPTVAWTTDLADWLHYSLDNYYCGDGDPYTSDDGSTMSSRDWIGACTDVMSRGSQVAFYSDHGDFHLFSAGLDGPPYDIVPDSCFDDDDVRWLCKLGEEHWPPFMLLLCCTAGTFNHTESRHPEGNAHHALCQDPVRPPEYDFGTDCMGEDFILNTRGGSIGVLCGSLSSSTSFYGDYGTGILDAVFRQGITRTGDALAYSRIVNLDHFWSGSGFVITFSQFNLLGDPAVDLGDGVQYPDCCDLTISPTNLEVNRYPTMSVNDDGEIVFMVSIRNAARLDAGPFNVRLDIRDEQSHLETIVVHCDGLGAGKEATLKFIWDSHIWFTPPGELTLTATATDPGHLTPDSWMPNNTASTSVYVVDFYPNDDGWPLRTVGSVRSPVALVDADSDGHLEIVVVEDPCFVSLYDPDLPGDPVWRIHLPVNATGNDGYSIPVIADVCDDQNPEILIDTKAVDGIASLVVINPSDGTILHEYAHQSLFNQLTKYPHTVAVGDIISQNAGNEIVFVSREEGGHNRYLQVLSIGQYGFELLDEKALPEGAVDCAAWPVISNISGDASEEIVVSYQYRRQHSGSLFHSGVWIYDWDDATGESSFSEWVEWNESTMHHGIPAVGELPGSGLRIALSRQYSNETQGLDPAVLLDPVDLGQSTPCMPSTVEDSENVLCCIMADWTAPFGEADRILANAENQCFAWDEDGEHSYGYPHTYTIPGSARPPFPALGNLDNEGVADLLVATCDGVVFALDDDGNLLSELGFPYQLSGMIAGGFTIADLDDDPYIEVVFGTMDNYLHVWELDGCEAGYAPWPQCQHDAARTGVLLEQE